MQPKQKGVISIGWNTLISAGVVLLLVGSYFAWKYLGPEPSPKTVVFSYLKTKTGQKAWPVSADLRQAKTPWLELGKMLQAANDYPTMYRHIGEHLTFADQLLASLDQAQQLTGLRVAIEASRGALNVAEDGRLATRICEAFLLPNLKLADAKTGVAPSRDQIIAQSLNALQSSEDFDGQAGFYRRVIKRETALHEADWCRNQLAVILGSQGKEQEALALLREIKDPTAGGKKVSKQISKLEKKLAKKQPPAVTATNTAKAK